MHQFISAAKEIGEFLAYRKKWWLAPIIVLLLLLGTVIVISAGSPIAPLLYTLF